MYSASPHFESLVSPPPPPPHFQSISAVPYPLVLYAVFYCIYSSIHLPVGFGLEKDIFGRLQLFPHLAPLSVDGKDWVPRADDAHARDVGKENPRSSRPTAAHPTLNRNDNRSDNHNHNRNHNHNHKHNHTPIIIIVIIIVILIKVVIVSS